MNFMEKLSIAVLFCTAFILSQENIVLALQISENQRNDSPSSVSAEGGVASTEVQAGLEDMLLRAQTLLRGHFYAEALDLLDGLDSIYPGEPRVRKLTKHCLEGQASLIPYSGSIPHVFFHSLVVDPKKAFDGDRKSRGYNAWMTTVGEFRKILARMHAQGYMLIDIGEIWEVVTDEDGNVSFRKRRPLVPAGKKPFILSVDDVNYYPFMKGDGFADRLELDRHGNVAARYREGEEIRLGEYDVVPILDNFVREHPGFSYRGAKGILAVTGYEGLLGYRTQELEAPDYADRVQAATEVVNRLKKTGWRFASHGYGHLHSARISLERLREDTARWKEEVGSLVGETEIYIFPFGEEIPYRGKKFECLKEEGFRVFCGVDSRDFLRVRKGYVRQMRRNLDGYTMLKRPERLRDLFDAEEVLDPSRPPLE